MKKILTIVVISILFSNCAIASEIIGKISTNPNALTGTANNQLAQEQPKGRSAGPSQAPVASQKINVKETLTPKEDIQKSHPAIGVVKVFWCQLLS